MEEQVRLEVSPRIIDNIVQSINDAVGDKIKEDIHVNRLKTRNSVPTRIWDLLNTDLCRRFNSPDCMAYTSKRGPWEMIMVFEKESGFLYTFMREKRFAEIHDKVSKRKRMHYIDMLVKYLNPDLSSPIGQESLFPVKFDDEDQLAEAVHKLLTNLDEDGVILSRHVLVLFESNSFALSSIRAIMVDSNLNVVAEENWSSHIAVQESIIADQVEDTNRPAENPARGLKLTAEATARKSSSPLRKTQEETAVK